MLRVYLSESHKHRPEISYTWALLAEARQIAYTWVNTREQADLTIGNATSDDVFVCDRFFEAWLNGSSYSFRTFFTNGPVLEENGRPDFISTIFYLVNSLQEYGSTAADELGRYVYTDSFQHHYNNITENYVVTLCKELCAATPALQRYVHTDAQTRFVLSHDIDTLYGSLAQDGKWALARGRVDILAGLVLRYVAANPLWYNIDAIMRLESEYDFKSVFFWLVNQGRINARETNSDYNIRSAKLTNTLLSVEKKGFQNGLHKSISTDTFDDELKKMPVPANTNRNHYLKFALPDHYRQVEKSGLQMDCSLGFAEHYGFRNSYGLPFYPYDLENRKSYRFLEAPLHIMDGTFSRYLRIPVQQTAQTIIDFIEKNKQNALLSILWHNTFFTPYKYKGYLEQYKQLLAYLYENKFENMLYSDVLKAYQHKNITA